MCERARMGGRVHASYECAHERTRRSTTVSPPTESIHAHTQDSRGRDRCRLAIGDTTHTEAVPPKIFNLLATAVSSTDTGVSTTNSRPAPA